MQGLVSVLIPAYNAGGSIVEALNSCLSQSYREIEVLVFNNGSDDDTESKVTAIPDARLRLISNPVNLGIAPARNRLLREAAGEFIAWVDADDQMLPGRISRQVEYMRQHPETDILGTWIKTDHKSLPSKRLPLDHELIRICLWFKNTMIQPSILSRNFYVKEEIFYNEEYKDSVEDYELWYRLRDVKKFANLPDYLTIYHLSLGIEYDMKKRMNEFESNLGYLWKKKWEDMPLRISDEDRKYFRFFLYNNRTLLNRELNSISKTLKALKHQNKDFYSRLIISYHYIRLWRNMNMVHKIINLHLLANMKNIGKMKKLHLL